MTVTADPHGMRATVGELAMAKTGKPKNSLRFDKPASWWGSTWREALPTGNGIIGAAVYGGAGSDIVMLNHRDLWWQGHVGVLQDVADKLPAVRKKMDADDPAAAQDIISSALISKNYRPQMAYPLPLCDFHIDFPLDRPVRDYQRSLELDNGEITVTFRDGATRYERSCFVSRANNTVCYEVTKSGKDAINATFSLSLHDKFNARTPVSVSKLPEGVNVRYENYFMYFSARSDNGTEFGCVARISYYGGSQSVDPIKGITIKGDLLEASPGETLDNVINQAIDHNLIGLEEIAGIPGTIAGAISVNAQANGRSISDVFFYADYLTLSGEMHRRPCYHEYFTKQNSIFSPDEFIISIALRLQPSKASAEARVRKEKYVELMFIPPCRRFSGEIFRDTEGMSAADAIRSAGLTGPSGFRAEFSEYQPNSIFTYPGCTPSEIYTLILRAEREVKEKLGIELERSITVLGSFRDLS